MAMKKKKAAAAKAAAKAEEADTKEATPADREKPAEVAASSKKKRKRAPGGEAEGVKSATEKSPGQQGKEAKKKEEDEDGENAFDAAGIIFFTRDADGHVSQVLLGFEERKVSANLLGRDSSGKITERMLIFPMGRRERKDKADSVECAKREYIEETGDYGGLSSYLDFADFDPSEEAPEEAASAGGKGDGGEDSPKAPWSGKQNMALLFKPARMICLFCEVPADAARLSHKAAVNGVSVDAKGEPLDKRLKKGEAPPKPSPSYRVGKTDHIECRWLQASALAAALASAGKAPAMDIGEEKFHMFPTAASVLRMREAREWLVPVVGAAQSAATAAEPAPSETASKE